MSRLDGQPAAFPAGTAMPSRIAYGAGVDPNKVCKPSKRLRNWHRASGHKVSLRIFARNVARRVFGGYGDSGPNDARRWLASKGIKP